MSDPNPADDLVAAVVDAVTANGGIDAARERAAVLARQAEEELESLPVSHAKETLRLCVTYSIERRR